MMKRIIISFFLIFAVAQTANAETWLLSVNYVNTNNVGHTNVRGMTEAGATISVRDANNKRLLCSKLFGLIAFNPEFSCSGVNLTPPLTVTAEKGILSIFSSKTPNVIELNDLYANSTPWALSVSSEEVFFGGIAAAYQGMSEQGAYITAVDAEGKKLFCMASLFGVVESGEFNCFGFAVVSPVTFNARSGLFSLFSDRADASVTFTAPATNTAQ